MKVNPAWFFEAANWDDPASLGAAILACMDACRRGDVDTLRAMPFVQSVVGPCGYQQRRPAVPSDVRARVMAVGKCAYCGSTRKLELDHIVAWSKGGTHDESNLQCLCKRCNRRKKDKSETDFLKTLTA